jgi:hypothetical protein
MIKFLEIYNKLNIRKIYSNIMNKIIYLKKEKQIKTYNRRIKIVFRKKITI